MQTELNIKNYMMQHLNDAVNPDTNSLEAKVLAKNASRHFDDYTDEFFPSTPEVYFEYAQDIVKSNPYINPETDIFIAESGMEKS